MFLLALLWLSAAVNAAQAQAYTSRAITVVVPFPAGGPSDVVARIITEHMGRTLGQLLVIENDGGAGGTLGSARVAAASPDGYTLLAGSMGRLKQNGDKVKQAHGGIGASSHMACLLFTSELGVKPIQVAYRGTGPAVNDLVGGHVDFLCEQSVSVAEQIRSGLVKGYVVSASERLASLPDIPSTKGRRTASPAGQGGNRALVAYSESRVCKYELSGNDRR